MAKYDIIIPMGYHWSTLGMQETTVNSLGWELQQNIRELQACAHLLISVAPLFADQHILARELSIASLMGYIISSFCSGMGWSEPAAGGRSELGVLRPTLVVTLGPSCHFVPSHSSLCSSFCSLGTWAQADYMKVSRMQIFRAGWLVSPCPKQ